MKQWDDGGFAHVVRLLRSELRGATHVTLQREESKGGINEKSISYIIDSK
jgi:hypothetical protein